MNPLRSFVLSVTLLLLVFGCHELPTQNERTNPKGAGQVAFSLAKSAIPNDVARVVATLTRSGYATIQDSVDVVSTRDTLKMVIGNIPAGTWNLLMIAKDLYGVVRYSGSAAVTLIDGQVTMVTIQMNATPQGGTLTINVVWPNQAVSWRMQPGNPIFQQTPGTEDEYHSYFSQPVVIKVDNEYKMWYLSGFSITNNGIDTVWTAYATSQDGINWTKHGKVLGRGSAGSWIDLAVVGRSVLYENGIYKMWFEAQSYSNTHNGIGYATSTDGMKWTVSPTPVISVSTQRPRVFQPWVLKYGGTYYLYYSVETVVNGQLREEIYLQTSGDGSNWSDIGKVLPYRSGYAWETMGVWSPCVLVDEAKFKMFYTTSNGTAWSIGYAESQDGQNWTYRPAVPEISVSDVLPWNVGIVAYPSVMRDTDGKLKMWFSGYAGHYWKIGLATKN